MLTEFYGLTAHPFLMTPDARFFFASAGHARAYAHLAYGLAQREGFVVVTGEVGAGKTTLIERLCMELDPNLHAVGRIMTSQLEGEDLLRLVADVFGASMEGSKAMLLAGITRALRQGGEAGRRHILIVDEAQGLTRTALEELRMLSNVTDGGRALLQTVLVGQPQLRALLSRPDLEQLRQRVLASYHLAPLGQEETKRYVEHRLRAVGWTHRPAWADGALEEVHRHSGGVPRRINRLCSRVLLAGALEGLEILDSDLVEATALELEDDLGGGVPEGDASLPQPAIRAEAPLSHREPAVLPLAPRQPAAEDMPPPAFATAAEATHLREPATVGAAAEPPPLRAAEPPPLRAPGLREPTAPDPQIAAISDKLDTLARVAERQERVVDRLIHLFARRRAGR